MPWRLSVARIGIGIFRFKSRCR